MGKWKDEWNQSTRTVGSDPHIKVWLDPYLSLPLSYCLNPLTRYYLHYQPTFDSNLSVCLSLPLSLAGSWKVHRAFEPNLSITPFYPWPLRLCVCIPAVHALTESLTIIQMLCVELIPWARLKISIWSQRAGTVRLWQLFRAQARITDSCGNVLAASQVR